MFNSEFNKISKKSKILFLFIFSLTLLIIYIIKLFSMQIINGEKYLSYSQKISSNYKKIPAARGEIYDVKAENPLVININTFAVEVIPAEIPSNKYDTTMSKLALLLGIPKNDIDKKIPKNKRRSNETFQVKTNVSFQTISDIAENKHDLPGVSWISNPMRSYYHTKSLSHIIGYVGTIDENEFFDYFNKGYDRNAIVGKTGIEKEYESYLQGKNGREMYKVDVHGKIISTTPDITPPTKGNDLILTIDSRIQKLAEEALGNRVGASIVLKPASGEILAMVSYPSFDSNIFNSDSRSSEYIQLLNDPSQPFINRAIQTTYPPASTFKIVMSTAMLQENAFPPEQKIECKGKMFYGGRIFNCHVHSGHGYVDLLNAMAQSCDVYYWTIGRDNLGIEKIASYAKEFGLGKRTGIDLPNEKAGLVPTEEWKLKALSEKWVGGNTMDVSIGQGFMEATPLQLANMIAMVSNKGKIYKPHILKEVRNSSNEVIKKVQPEIIVESTIDDSVWTQIQHTLRYTVTDGTPQYPMNNKIVQIACKTGTAEVDGINDSWHSWLVAYAPYDAPPEDRICVVTLVEACNTWEWWAPYATNIIIQGIFANQTCEEATKELGFEYLTKSRQRME